MTEEESKRFSNRVRCLLTWEPTTKKEAALTGAAAASLPLALSWWHNWQNLPLLLAMAATWFVLFGLGNPRFRRRYQQRKALEPERDQSQQLKP
ncbi:MAG: hypothetical protein H0T73_09565 [Ardenticatenales bacterium]|nr:hypothetical protein [Ardenticatenales bacterium]